MSGIHSGAAGPVREEAERLVAALVARYAAARAAGGATAATAYDPQRAQRLARAAGDVAVAVTGLLRELAGPHDEPAPPHASAGLREGFVGLVGGLLDAAGVDLNADPPAPEPRPWQAAGGPSATAGADPWQAATRDAWRAATRESERNL